MYKILRNIVVSTTVIAAIIYLIYSFFGDTRTLYEYMVLSLLILISTTFLLEIFEDKNRWNKIISDISNINNNVQNLAECKISIYENSNDWVEAMNKLISDGKHSIDTASLDSTTRSKVKTKHDKIWNHIKNLCENKNIKFRHIIRIRKNNFENLLDRIISGNSYNDTYFAYYELPQKYSFATFGIIDNKYISTRNPYGDGEIPKYIIIENKEMVQHYKSWFDNLWINSNKIISAECLDKLYKLFSEEYTNTEKNRIVKKITKIRGIGIMDDI